MSAAQSPDSSTPATDAIALPELEVVAPKKKPKKASSKPVAAEAPSAVSPADVAFPEGAIVASSGPQPAIAEQQRAAYAATGSVNYISGETINRFSGTSPADFLRGVPGVTIGETRNGGGIDANVRGLQGQRRVAVTVDGADSTIDSYRGYAGTQQRSYLDPDLISGATISKGPSASQGAIGGTIAMTTITADDVLRDGQSMGVRVKGGIASNSTPEPTSFLSTPEADSNGLFDPQSGYGSLAFAIRQPGFDIVGGYAIRDQGNYFAGKKGRDAYRIFTRRPTFTREEASVGKYYKEGEEVLNSSVETESLLLKTVLRPGDGQTLELGFRTYDSEMGEVMPSQILRNSTGVIPQWRPGYYDNDTLTGSYSLRPAGNDLIDLKISGFYSNFDSDAFNNPAGEGPRPFWVQTDEAKDPGYRNLYGANMETIRFGLDIANTSRLATIAGPLKFDYGLSAEREDLHPDDGNYPISEDDINNGRFLRSGVRDQINAFGNVEWKPWHALTLEAGARYTHYKLRDRNRDPIKGIGPKYCVITYNDSGPPSPRSSQLRWPADANGQCTAATDPRSNPNSWVNRSGAWIQLGRYLAQYNVTNAANPSVSGIRQDANSVAVGFTEPIERQDGGLAASASAAYELFKGTKLYTKYAEGIRLPGLFESTLGYYAVAPGEALAPERAQNWEFGASTVQQRLLTQRDEGMLKVAYFDNTVKNFITRFYDSKYDPVTFQDTTTFNVENNDSFRVRGLELQAAYDAGAFFFDGSVTKYFEATTCNARRAETLRNDPNGEFIPDNATTPNCIAGGFVGSFTNIQNPPQYSVTVTGGVRLFDERLTLGGRYLYTSEPIAKLDKDYNGGDLAPQLTYDKPVVLVDLFSSFKINENTEMTFGVDNVANRYYIDPLTVSYMPAPGRTFKAGFNAKF